MGIPGKSVRRILLPSLIVVSLAAGAQDPDSGQNDAHPCESGNEFHHFDFWVGEWDVHDAAGTLVGQNRISRREQGCALLEEWQGATGSTGMSINYFDPGTARWKQSWVSAGAYLIEIEGGLNEAGAMALSGRIYYFGPGKEAAFRGLWTPLDDGRVRQFFEQSDDAGETWQPWFEGFYSRQTKTADR